MSCYLIYRDYSTCFFQRWEYNSRVVLWMGVSRVTKSRVAPPIHKTTSELYSYLWKNELNNLFITFPWLFVTFNYFFNYASPTFYMFITDSFLPFYPKRVWITDKAWLKLFKMAVTIDVSCVSIRHKWFNMVNLLWCIITSTVRNINKICTESILSKKI